MSKQTKEERCIKQKKYSRTINGVITTIYTTQKNNSKKRGHKEPEYSKKELFDYLITNEKFNKLYVHWRDNGYKKEDKPTLDRINPIFGYSFNNIVVKKWSSNLLKAREDRKAGLDSISKPVAKYSIDGEILEIFSTVRRGARLTNLKMQNISKCCHGETKTCGGYIWKFL